ncbi:CidA/LrgA family protein [Thiolapillus sp.]|uniref:CidA/LrgA family protein n=3 Tax=Thiolapillus sp. TaxID=2017437 RepID=UPI0025D3E11D|nr:CidA/LrgA family protein [Thiolapillus sp.]
MTFLNGMTLLLIYQLVGEIGVHMLQWPVPGPVLGMVLLFLTLLLRKGIPASIDSSSHVLLNHLSLLFVPAGVGMMVYLERLKQEWLPIVAALFLGTLITLSVSALVMQATTRLFSSRVPEDG